MLQGSNADEGCKIAVMQVRVVMPTAQYGFISAFPLVEHSDFHHSASGFLRMALLRGSDMVTFELNIVHNIGN